MFAVIFKAKINQLDDHYSELAQKLRELALSEYGCIEFNSCTEGDQEIAISYWPDLESIKNWKQDSLHLQAQEKGRSSYYSSYQVDVVKVERQYKH